MNRWLCIVSASSIGYNATVPIPMISPGYSDLKFEDHYETMLVELI